MSVTQFLHLSIKKICVCSLPFFPSTPQFTKLLTVCHITSWGSLSLPKGVCPYTSTYDSVRFQLQAKQNGYMTDVVSTWAIQETIPKFSSDILHLYEQQKYTRSEFESLFSPIVTFSSLRPWKSVPDCFSQQSSPHLQCQPSPRNFENGCKTSIMTARKISKFKILISFTSLCRVQLRLCTSVW